jgi:hypothetical protein
VQKYEQVSATRSDDVRGTIRPASREPPAHAREEQKDAAATPALVVQRVRLADEVRAFERAESAFSRGDIETAASELTLYERSFSHGALSREAQVLRIEIVEARGDHVAARVLATAFLEANPSVPAARRVRRLLMQSGGNPFP